MSQPMSQGQEPQYQKPFSPSDFLALNEFNEARRFFNKLQTEHSLSLVDIELGFFHVVKALLLFGYESADVEKLFRRSIERASGEPLTENYDFLKQAQITHTEAQSPLK